MLLLVIHFHGMIAANAGLQNLFAAYIASRLHFSCRRRRNAISRMQMCIRVGGYPAPTPLRTPDCLNTNSNTVRHTRPRSLSRNISGPKWLF